jgi:putative membrane protein
MPESLLLLSLWQWTEPYVLLSLVPFAAAYLWAVSPAGRRHFRGAGPVPAWQVSAFLGALSAIYFGFGGPLDVLADGYLFTAHMLQHTLETMVAAPLLLVSLPDWLLDPVLDSRLLSGPLRFFTRPVVAATFFAVVFSLSLWPPAYDLYERSESLHFLMHGLLLVSALAMWWPVWSPTARLPRLKPLMRFLYIFLDTLPMIAPLAMVMLQTQPIYPYYDHTPRLFGLSQLADQQLGAAVMFSLMHASYIVAFLVAFFQWTRAERQERPRLRVLRPGEGPEPALERGRV